MNVHLCCKYHAFLELKENRVYDVSHKSGVTTVADKAPDVAERSRFQKLTGITGPQGFLVSVRNYFISVI